ncbi:MAG: C40 family peptidase [Ferruginibacter sp.]
MHKILLLCLFMMTFHFCTSQKAATTSKPPEASHGQAAGIKYDPIQIKYAKYLHVSPNEITSLSLYRFIDDWLGTPYLWGGTTKKGIDCSAFVQTLLLHVYDINVVIPRTSIEQFLKDWIKRFYLIKYLAEGDLIFFRTNKNKLISHIGLYLKNGMFVNSSSKGVSIASIYDPYWRKKMVAFGRIKLSARK